jgi:hypothetical protein
MKHKDKENNSTKIRFHSNPQKKPQITLKLLTFWVNDRVRTGDPRYHKPML